MIDKKCIKREFAWYTKCVMSKRQKNRKTDRQKDIMTERQGRDRKTMKENRIIR